MSNPLVSVLLAVHNGEATLTQCLQSIAQQEYAPLEIIAVDDGSTDASAEILRAFAGRTIQISTNQSTQGLTKSLNTALVRAAGKYIARIDADDVWQPQKIARQVDFMEKNPDVGVLGTWYTNRTGSKERRVQRPVTHAAITRQAYRLNPFGHSCILARTALIRQVGGYDESIDYGQDYDLWLRLIPHTRFHNLPEYLCTRHVPRLPNEAKRRAQMKQMIHTIVRHATHNHAPPAAYLGAAVPLLILLVPLWVRKLRR